jgi:preprotein translocase subunit YajC
MSLTMFIIGLVIFIIYVYFLIWNIFYSTKKQRQENKYSDQPDVLDSDGMGDFSRFPKN